MADIIVSPDYRIAGGVSIALDALDAEEKRAIEGVIRDRDHFLASTADARKVRKISNTDPFYSLEGPSGLRIIYSKVGDEIVIMALMHQKVLDYFGQPEARKSNKGRTKTVRDSSATKKAI